MVSRRSKHVIILVVNALSVHVFLIAGVTYMPNVTMPLQTILKIHVCEQFNLMISSPVFNAAVTTLKQQLDDTNGKDTIWTSM